MPIKELKNIVFISGASSEAGNTFRVIQCLRNVLKVESVVLMAKDFQPLHIQPQSLFLFLSPTLGDEELPLPMEIFLNRLDLNFTGISYGICELGNYYGYDDFSFGAADIIRKQLNKQYAIEAIPTLSLDSMPIIDWDRVEHWALIIETGMRNV